MNGASVLQNLRTEEIDEEGVGEEGSPHRVVPMGGH